MEEVKAREGDFIETIEGLIFDVKGLIHPPRRIIAYLRYIEDPLGERVRCGRRYKKVYSLTDRDKIVRDKYPQYMHYDEIFGEWMESIPTNLIMKHYKPEWKVMELMGKDILDETENCALKLIETIHDTTQTPIGKMGVTGSILVNLHTKNSDIDITIYGQKNCTTVYEELKRLLEEGEMGFRKYDREKLSKLYEFRVKDTWMSFEDFQKIERRKVSQGEFLNREFFIRFILDWDEVEEKYGEKAYRTIGYARVKALIEDDKYAIFTPCKYMISNVELIEGECNPNKLVEITSFRGRFCEQAKKGEWIIAQGKIEMVTTNNGEEYHRMILGGKPSDFMILKE
jgi:predicted nucleotidyltransferase